MFVDKQWPATLMVLGNTERRPWRISEQNDRPSFEAMNSPEIGFGTAVELLRVVSFERSCERGYSEIKLFCFCFVAIFD